MIERKRKLRLIQISLLFTGLLIIYFTYFSGEKSSEQKLVSKENQDRVQKQLKDQSKDEGDIFFNISYSGRDLAGNRYVLTSKEAQTNKTNQEIVNMKIVKAQFYFKDGKILKVNSNKGVYNNKTLDMTFEGNVVAKYDGSSLFAQKAEYSNSESFLLITSDVKINDLRGTIVADELLFDIKKQTLDIASFNDGKINANLNLK